MGRLVLAILQDNAAVLADVSAVLDVARPSAPFGPGIAHQSVKVGVIGPENFADLKNFEILVA